MSRIQDVSETLAVFERQLNDGSSLEYHLQVLQQPERARACGQGAKSHADRRPVDPPPVVELRLFQGSGANKADVTFSHNSNFVLFATLDHARPVAQARGMPAPAPAPVLTGVPVSGMAYLDRPNPAGYFIFPDLSVRHEGMYRLRFALYEETKEDSYATPVDPYEPREFCTHRLDVKSKPFTVFSAKKFPGLAESTALSRIVAEQGCRVRIRRDVRMRRRSDRPRGTESEELVDQTEMLRARRRRTPEYDLEPAAAQYSQPSPYPMQRAESVDRKRSGSNASMASMPDAAPRYDGSGSGGGGGGAAGAGGYPPYGHPPAPPAPSTANQHLAFGGASHPPPPNIHPPQMLPQEMFTQQSQRYMNGQPTQTQPQYAAAAAAAAATYGSREPVQQNPTRNDIPRRPSVEDFRARRDSETAGYQTPQQPYRPSTPSVTPQYANGQVHNGYSHQQYTQPPPVYQQQPAVPPPPPAAPTATAAAAPSHLPPLRLPPMEPKLWANQPATPGATATPTLPSPAPYGGANSAPAPQKHRSSTIAPTPSAGQFPAYYPEQSKYSGSNGYTAPPQQPEPTDSSKKRPWGRVFNSAHTEGSMYNKMRPETNTEVYGADPVPSYGTEADDDDDSYDIGKLKMTYRRADGVEIVRKLPGDE